MELLDCLLLVVGANPFSEFSSSKKFGNQKTKKNKMWPSPAHPEWALPDHPLQRQHLWQQWAASLAKGIGCQRPKKVHSIQNLYGSRAAVQVYVICCCWVSEWSSFFAKQQLYCFYDFVEWPHLRKRCVSVLVADWPRKAREAVASQNGWETTNPLVWFLGAHWLLDQLS